MAITLQSQNQNGSSVNDEMIFVVYESTKAIDPVTYPDYSYVCDVYVDSDLVARLISRPDPQYAMGLFDVAKVLQGYCSYEMDQTYAVVDYDPKISYRLKFGEQYDGTLYTNLLTDSTDRYAYKTYQTRPFEDTVVLRNGLASNMPRVLNWHVSTGNQFLSFFSDVSGITDMVQDIYINGAYSSSSTYSNSGFVAGKIRQVPIDSSNEGYSIFSGAGVSLRVNHLCRGKYTPYQLVWLNPYGAYDCQTFGLVSKKRYEIAGKDFSQLPYKIDSGGNLSYSANSVMYGSKRGYYRSARVLLSLTSHLLTDEEYTWLADLFMSPQVYIYDTNIGVYVPVTITATTYEFRNYLNSRLTPLQFDIEFTEQFNSQLL